jgi:hypothetical protein
MREFGVATCVCVCVCGAADMTQSCRVRYLLQNQDKKKVCFSNGRAEQNKRFRRGTEDCVDSKRVVNVR